MTPTPLIELYGAPTHEDLIAWVRAEYGIGSNQTSNPHRARREEIARRVRLYRDDAEADFTAIIRRIFEDSEVQRQRIALIEVAKEQNVSRRIVEEVASLYDRPAVRTLPDASSNTLFHEVEQRTSLHEVMQTKQRLLLLCNDVLIWQFDGVDGKNKLRVVTPDLFDALPDPRDSSVMAGLLLDVCPLSILPGRDQRAHYELWDAVYRYQLNAAGQLLGIIEHGIGRIPGALLHLREPTDRLLDSRSGRDITSAHLGTAVLNVMIMRLSKSQGERQPVLKGPLANVAKNQRMDGESPIALPPEVEAMMLDTKTDPDHYLAVKREKLSSVAQTYGMSYEQLAYQETSDTASGKVYQLRREKLTELRSEQRRRALMDEREIVLLLGFDPTGMRVDYREQALPQDASEEIQLLVDMTKLGLDNPIAYLMRKDPDITEAEAWKRLRDNLAVWAKVVMMQRDLNMPNEPGNPGRSPQANGAMGGADTAGDTSGDTSGDTAANDGASTEYAS